MTLRSISEYLFVRLDLRENFIALPLGPKEVVLTPVFKVSHWPPETRLQSCSNQDRIIAPANVVLVGRECGSREFEIEVVWLIDFNEKLSVVFLLQL